MTRADRDADRGAHVNRLLGNLVRLVEGGERTSRDQLRLLRVADGREKQCKLVAGQPGQQRLYRCAVPRFRLHHLAKTIGDHDQHVIALRVAEIVVDLLERSEEHTSELQSLMRLSYAVFCLKKQNK